MQEHIRRAHPEYYIPKLPATKESFDLMINTPPHEHPPPPDPTPQQQPQHSHQLSDPSGLSPAFHLDAALNSTFEGVGVDFGGGGGGAYHHPLYGHHDGYVTTADSDAAAVFNNMEIQRQRSSDEYRRGSLIPAASAAAALAQLQYHRADWDGVGGHDISQVIFPSLAHLSPTVTEADFLQNFYHDQQSQHDLKHAHHNHFDVDPALEDTSFMHDAGGFPVGSSSAEQPGLLPSSLGRSSPPPHPFDHSRATTSLPPLQRRVSHSQQGRPRKSSLSQQARMAKHERRKSKEVKRTSGGDRKAFSAEPSAATLYGKRWEDLIDAAASATEEEGSRDLTPVSSAYFCMTQPTYTLPPSPR